MEKKASVVVLLLLLFLIDELMVQTEARTCYSRSKKFHGICFFERHLRNCKTICKQERFSTGQCYRRSCLCSKKCGSSGFSPPHPPPSDGGDGGGEGGGDGGGESGGGGPGGGEGGEAVTHH